MALATSEFGTDYQVRYEVKTDGKARVTQDISLINKLSNVYATQYSLSLQAGRVENIEAHDTEGPLRVETTKTDQLTTIKLYFNQQVVGKDKTLSFHLAYDAFDLASKNGQVWEIAIPKLSPQTQIDHYSLTLAVPLSFGEPAFMTPQPVEHRQEGGLNLFLFSQDQILNSGVSTAFGQFQIFDFVFYYHLQNPHRSWGETEITLPPDTTFQRVFYQKIEPLPMNITVDPDGNWQALYRLKPQEKLNITATGKAKIFAQPQEKFIIPSENVLAKNLLPQKFWETDDPLIQAEAKQLKTPRQIYQFVVRTLDYDFSRVKEGAERLGAATALKNPQRAICTEFTDLFIALARVNGIPAREINGYAYTTNIKLKPLGLVADILHSWPEYWNDQEQVWTPVDPTWEKTTGGIDYFYKTDLSHFVFAIHGQDSQNPYPAGSYKVEDTASKDIQVVFGEYEAQESSKYEVEFDLPQKIFSSTEGRGEVVIQNIGGGAIYNLPLKLTLQNLSLTSPTNLPEAVTVLPPFSQIKIPLRFKAESWFSLGQGTIKIFIDDQEKQAEIKIDSFFWQLVFPPMMIVGLAFGVLFMLRIKPRNTNEKISPPISY